MQLPMLTLLAALGCAAPETVFQQLVGAGRAGPCHQAHGSFVKKDLEGQQGGWLGVGWRQPSAVSAAQC